MSARKRHRKPAPPPIRIVNTQTGKRITAQGGKDAAAVVGAQLDENWYRAAKVGA